MDRWQSPQTQTFVVDRSYTSSIRPPHKGQAGITSQRSGRLSGTVSSLCMHDGDQTRRRLIGRIKGCQGVLARCGPLMPAGLTNQIDLTIAGGDHDRSSEADRAQGIPWAEHRRVWRGSGGVHSAVLLR